MHGFRMPVFFHENQLLHHPPSEWDSRGLMPHPESPDRARRILAALQAEPARYEIMTPSEIPLGWIEKTHTPELLQALRSAEQLPEDQTHYITLFPKRNQANPDPANLLFAGAFCFDTSTPLTRHTWTSAAWSAASAVSAAQALMSGKAPAAYALCRPPGHHADRGYFGGYCYLNNAAIAATCFKQSGRVAVLDLDFHHGDGTQAIFYEDPQVLSCSIHADPADHYPHCTGRASEAGAGAGLGSNLNIPLPGGSGLDAMQRALNEYALPAIEAFKPAHLVIALGLDTYREDPLGDFQLTTDDYGTLGERLGQLACPVLVIQEGGYHVSDLGQNVRAFLDGVRQGKMTALTEKSGAPS